MRKSIVIKKKKKKAAAHQFDLGTSGNVMCSLKCPRKQHHNLHSHIINLFSPEVKIYRHAVGGPKSLKNMQLKTFCFVRILKTTFFSMAKGHINLWKCTQKY